MDTAWRFVRDKLFYPPSGLIYDHAVKDRAEEFPSPEEIRRGYPNPCGYTTGMEDGMIHGATMLDACLCRFAKKGDKETAEFARDLLCGMLRTAESAEDGFIPRAVSPIDSKSYYTDSSRDQYTMLFFALHRYLHSPLCTGEDRERIARVTAATAYRAERNVRPETGYDMLRADGGPTLVTTMWGDSLGNHEYLRLPMLYLTAWEAAGDPHFLDLYHAIREKAYEKSLPMTSYWHLYALQQMQASVLICCEADTDPLWKAKYLSLMHKVADYTAGKADWVRNNLRKHTLFNEPQCPFRECPAEPNTRYARLGVDCVSLSRRDADTFFTMQDAANLVIIQSMVPGRQTDTASLRVFAEAFAQIDFSRHERAVPVHYLDAYYRSI